MAIRESFIAIVPFVILISCIKLLYPVIGYLGSHLYGIDNNDILDLIRQLNVIVPFVILISISYSFAKRYSIDYIMSIILSLSILISIQSVLFMGRYAGEIIDSEMSFLVIIIPVSTTFLLRLYFSGSDKFSHIGVNVNKVFNNIYTFFIIYNISIIAYLALISTIGKLFRSLRNVFILFSDDALFVIRSIVEHLLWFVGVNGSNAFDVLVGDDFLRNTIVCNLNYKEFYDLFVILGGSGAGLSLIIAIYVSAKDDHCRNIAKIATPFALFNINELLIFGIPIVFNRKLFIPFISVPLVNIVIAYVVLSIYRLPIEIHDVPWITPIFINSYYATGGSVQSVMMQLFILVIDILIYMPFIRRYTTSQSLNSHYNKLQNDLDITIPLKALEGLVPYREKQKIIVSNAEVEKIINLLSQETLMIYYQPKVDIQAHTCIHYEALLRLKLDNGKITGPFFLNNLEDGGLAPIIDTWVCQEVKKNILAWGVNEFYPKISINLHPDTLRNTSIIGVIINLLKSEDIEFELLERDLYDDDLAKKNILSLKENGFKIAIDDMGSGYSSLKTLCLLPIDTVKLDKSLIDLLHEPKAYSLSRHIVEYCDELNISCVAEGVETLEQLELTQKLKIKYVQGFYFSPAIELSKESQFKYK